MIFSSGLLYTSIAVAVSIILGFVIYINDRKNSTNRVFFYLSITTSLWLIFNFLFSKAELPSSSLMLLRASTAFAVINSFLTYYIFYIFPESKVKLTYSSLFFIFFTAITTAITLLTPFVFKSISMVDNSLQVTNGPAIPMFSIAVLGFNLGAFYILIRKRINEKNETRKMQLQSLFLGSIITFPLIIIFNFILPAFLGESRLIEFGPLFVIPFMGFIAYAIIKYRLFNTRVIATELVTFSLWIFIIVRTIISTTTSDFLANGLLLVVTIIVGILLINSVFKEVKQRERLELLRYKLEEANLKLEYANDKLQDLDKLKTEFLSLASHQLRSPLTAIKGYASMVNDGDFGVIPKEAHDAVDRIFQSSQNLTKIVEDLLNVSKIEQGGMKYEMAPFDLKAIASEMTQDLSIVAEKKQLELKFEAEGDDEYMVNGDKEKIRQVIINLIDNSIKYTKEGSITVSVKKNEGKAIFSVKDTGMGMTEEIKVTLFQKFSRGEGARMNTGGSGLGLYLAKEIVEGHKGKVWVESEGPGKGSTFFMELDLLK